MEWVSFMWFAIEDSISETSVERVRIRDVQRGEARAFRPGRNQLSRMEVKEGEGSLPCRMATFRSIIVDGDAFDVGS